MRDIINELLSINYTDYYEEANYKEVAYTILNTLNKNELIEIVEAENIWISKSNIEELKLGIYDNLVRFRCDRQVLGEVAAHSYRKSRLG